MKIGITANPGNPAAIRWGREIVERLGSRAEVVLSEALAAGTGRPGTAVESMAADVVVAVGGDGTFLYTIRRTTAPLLPINAGTVGVLAEVDARQPGALDRAVDALGAGRYFLEERLRLAAEIGGEPLPDVLNEYVVHAGQVGRMGLFEIAFDGRTVGRIRADGLIVATPTGSTGYSLSSLGPVVDPAVEAIVLTAIAPFRAEARALVVDPLRTIQVRAVEASAGTVVLADGEEEHPLPAGAPVTIYRSPRRATLVRFGATFFDRLRGKRILPWSEGPEGGRDADLPAGA